MQSKEQENTLAKAELREDKLQLIRMLTTILHHVTPFCKGFDKNLSKNSFQIRKKEERAQFLMHSRSFSLFKCGSSQRNEGHSLCVSQELLSAFADVPRR